LLLLPLPLAASGDVTSEETTQSVGGSRGVALAYAAFAAAEFEGAEAGREASSAESRLSANLSFAASRSRAFTLGFDYQYTRFEYDRIAGRDRDLHRMQIPLGFTWRGPAWNVDAAIAPGLSTSSNVFNSFWRDGIGHDVIVTGRIEGSYRSAADRLRWLTGLAHDRAFGEPRLYPILGVLYSPRPALSMRLALPESELRYAASDRQYVSARLYPAGHRWHVASEELGDNFDYRVEALRLEGNWSYRLLEAVWIDVSAGYEFRRHHRFIDDRRQLIDADLDDELFAAIGFRFGSAPIPWSHRPALQVPAGADRPAR